MSDHRTHLDVANEVFGAYAQGIERLDKIKAEAEAEDRAKESNTAKGGDDSGTIQ